MLFSSMNITAAIKNRKQNNYSHCYGCGLCTLVCPVWHQNHDICCTPHGHAKAMQSDGEVNVIGLFDCILCGACEPVCPANIEIMEMMIKLRQNHVDSKSLALEPKSLSDNPIKPMINPVLFLADDALLEHKMQSNNKLLNQTLKLLNSAGVGSVGQAQDNGADIIKAIKSGLEISPDRVEEFLAPIKLAKKLIVSDCLLRTALQQWLPNVEIMSPGYVLSNLPAIKNKLSEKDLYVIECRAYNANFKKMVAHYNQLKQHSGCQLNLDLQRLAMPTGGLDINKHRLDSKTTMTTFDPHKQSQWILQGLNIDRIVVESVEDAIAIMQVSDKPIIHVAELLSS